MWADGVLIGILMYGVSIIVLFGILSWNILSKLE